MRAQQAEPYGGKKEGLQRCGLFLPGKKAEVIDRESLDLCDLTFNHYDRATADPGTLKHCGLR